MALIPGLPNDLAVLCLLRLPAGGLVRAQQVSSLWRIVIQSDRFYVERRRRNRLPSIFAIRRMPHAYQCLDADIADLQHPRLLFSCDDHEGQKLFPSGMVFASVENTVYGFAPGHHVQRFSLLTRCWTQVSKTFPHGCKLMVSTLGRHVVVVACNKQNHDVDDDSDNDHDDHSSDELEFDDSDNDHDDHSSDELEFAHTMCEILDTLTNQWAYIDGLPDHFYGTHCITHEDTVYVKGKTSLVPRVVYGLNLTQRRWSEDSHMSAMLRLIQDDSKLLMQSRSVLLATSSSGMVKLSHLNVSTDIYTEVLCLTVSLPCSFFLFRQSEQIFLVVRGEASSWQAQKAFFYNGLSVLSIPGDLLMVDAIAGQAMSK